MLSWVFRFNPPRDFGLNSNQLKNDPCDESESSPEFLCVFDVSCPLVLLRPDPQPRSNPAPSCQNWGSTKTLLIVVTGEFIYIGAASTTRPQPMPGEAWFCHLQHLTSTNYFGSFI